MDRLRNLKMVFTNSPKSKDQLIVNQKITGNQFSIPLHRSQDYFYFKCEDIANIKNSQGQKLRWYDPGLANTISADSKICYIDGQKGLLQYRGYSIEQLAEKSSFLEVTFLLIHGQLPGKQQLMEFQQKISDHRVPHFDLGALMKTFRYNAHPMGILISTIASYSSLNPDSNPSLKGTQIYNDPLVRNKQIYTLLGIFPTLAANSYRHRIGRAYNLPQPQLGYVENFLYMLDRLSETNYIPHPRLVKALETMFIIQAQHQMNCSTALLRHLTSAGTDIYTAVANAAGALYGTKHGAANAAVIKMLEQIGSKQKVGPFIIEVKQKKRILYGFGHRVYKSQDPRAKITKKVAEQVFQICGKQPLIEVAIEIQRRAIQDDYFITRKLYPNVDFYNGLIYRAMGFPTDMYPVLFALPLLAGWLAHWNQAIKDLTQAILFWPRHTKLYRNIVEERDQYRLYNFDLLDKQAKVSSQTILDQPVKK